MLEFIRDGPSQKFTSSLIKNIKCMPSVAAWRNNSGQVRVPAGVRVRQLPAQSHQGRPGAFHIRSDGGSIYLEHHLTDHR